MCAVRFLVPPCDSQGPAWEWAAHDGARALCAPFRGGSVFPRLMPSRTAGTELTAASTSDARDCAVFVDGEELPSTSKPGGDGTAASNIYIEVDLSTQAAETAARRRDPFPGQLDAAPTAGYTTVRGVLSSRFMLSQVLFNMVGSATGPLLCFYLLFGVISTGPYSWDAPEVRPSRLPPRSHHQATQTHVGHDLPVGRLDLGYLSARCGGASVSATRSVLCK